MRVDEVVGLPRLDRVHELPGHGDGDVEVRHLREIFLAADELQDVRVIDPQNPHIRAAPRASLLDCISRGIIQLHERDWSTGDPGGRANHRSLRAQAREGETRPAAALMYERHRGERVINPVLPVRQRVFHRQHEARAQLA